MWLRVKRLWELSGMEIYTTTSGNIMLRRPTGIKRPATVVQDDQI